MPSIPIIRFSREILRRIFLHLNLKLPNLVIGPTGTKQWKKKNYILKKNVYKL